MIGSVRDAWIALEDDINRQFSRPTYSGQLLHLNWNGTTLMCVAHDDRWIIWADKAAADREHSND